jgi:lactate dehydrogenase-like 2-hydroxyacid dehydrogenase
MQAAELKTVGIIGAGRIGQAIAQIARRAGRQVVISNSQGPTRWARWPRPWETACRPGR